MFVPLLLSACASPVSYEKARAGIVVGDVKSVEWAMSPISYWRDYTEADEFRPCKDTFILGYGDCEDFAICAKDFTDSWPGCNSTLFIVEGRKSYHAITTLTCPNLYGYFDNGSWNTGKPPYKVVREYKGI